MASGSIKNMEEGGDTGEDSKENTQNALTDKQESV